MRNTWTLVFTHFSYFKKTLHRRIIYLIIFDRVDKLSRKNMSEENIGFWLRIWITLHFTGFGLLEILWTAIYNYTYYILYWRWIWKYLDYIRIWIRIIIFYRIWTLIYLDYGFGFPLLFILLDLDLKVLGLRIWITIITFYWIWIILVLWFRIMINLICL